MEKLKLQSDECVILRSNKVLYGGMMATYTDELILTNLNIIHVKKNFLGLTRNIFTYPLNNIKFYNGKAQALLGKQSNGSPWLEVYFLNHEEFWGFQSKIEVKRFISSINQLVCGDESTSKIGEFAISGIEVLAATIKDTISSFKKIMTPESKKQKVAGKCDSCGASIEGYKGNSVKCIYCGTYHAF